MRLSVQLENWACFSVTQPLTTAVASNSDAYLRDTGCSKLGWRHFRRLVYFKLSGQADLCQANIQPEYKRVLWLYRGIPQLGDALMDLAPRSLLCEAGFTVDLYTEPHIAALFHADPYFSKAIGSYSELDAEAYDFVIVPSNKKRSLSDKARFLPKLPWLSMHGFYTGPEFHRARFATQRLVDALNLSIDPADFETHARQKLAPLPAKSKSNRRLKLGIAMGGVDPLRTYSRWREVLQPLMDRPGIELTLLGSDNGLILADTLAKKWPASTYNRVGRTTLQECRALINDQDVFVSCDGGLMHLAVTTSTRLVSLFQSTIQAQWRLPDAFLPDALQSSTADVNAIEPERIIQKVMQHVMRFG